MKARRILALIGTLAVIYARAASAADEPGSSVKGLEVRVQAFYQALSHGRYEDVYDFLGPTMKQDNPKKEYVDRLRSTLRGFDAGPPAVTLKPLYGVAKPPLGAAVSHVTLIGQGGDAFPVVYTTLWVWQEPTPGKRPDWLLAGDSMKRGDFSAVLPTDQAQSAEPVKSPSGR